MVMVGGGGGRIQGGQVLDYLDNPDRQMCRLFLSMMDWRCQLFLHLAHVDAFVLPQRQSADTFFDSTILFRSRSTLKDIKNR